ncbi:MAG: threonine ammonia-lyase [Thermoprotei archaeon]|nr:MAG: threonine ammonia-lyase [Thermoprotei archaeon]
MPGPEQPVSKIIDYINGLIPDAYNVIRSVVHFTPAVTVTSLNDIVGKRVYLKLENLQKTGAYKVRGATYKIKRLLRIKRLEGVVTASSGNHAQAVAYAAKVNGIKAVIVMPETASATKIQATRSYGAEVVLHGQLYDEAYEKAIEIAKSKGYEFIHPFDDPEIIAGQGTIGLEILNQVPDVKEILVPIGGGGLISGISIAVKKRKPDVKIIGVQPKVAASMKYFIEGKLEGYKPSYSIADGVVVKNPGKYTSKIVSELVDDIILVDEEDISHAVFFLLERGKIIAEGAGALPIAALLSGAYTPRNDPIVSVISGGNIDPSLLSRIIIHELSKDGRLVTIRGVVDDKPGILHDILEVIASYKLNIVDIKHDRVSPYLMPTKAIVELIFEASSHELVEKALNELKRRGFEFKIKAF